MNNMNNPFKPQEVKLVNYNSLTYENKKMDNIVDNKMKMYQNKINPNNQNLNQNQPQQPMPSSYSGDIEAKKSRIDSLNKLNRYGNRNN